MANTKTYAANAFETTLSFALGVGATTINVVTSTGSPSVPFYATLEPSLDAKREVVLVTAKTATTFTATRAQDGTTDVAHNSGVVIKVVPVAAHINDLHDRIDTVSTTANAAYTPGGTDVAVADGGTGASTAAAARTNLGLGTIATQAANNVAITGGSVTGITDLAVADGGTGASDAATARTNLAVVGTVGGDTITASAAGVKGLVIKGAASQSANLQEWQNSAGSVQAAIEADGVLRLYNGATTLRVSSGAGGAIASGTSAGSINITINGTAYRIPYFA